MIGFFKTALVFHSTGVVAPQDGSMKIDGLSSENVMPTPNAPINDAGLTPEETRIMYPSLGRMLICKNETCEGDVQWQPRIRYASTTAAAIIDIYPGDEYCFVCGDTPVHSPRMIHEE